MEWGLLLIGNDCVLLYYSHSGFIALIVCSTVVLARSISTGPLEDAFGIKGNVVVDVLAIVATIDSSAINGPDVMINGRVGMLSRHKTKIYRCINIAR
jgi:hypothetical protein